MYYVPDGTKECGFYECKKCGNRFLSLQTMNRIPCPECEAEIDYEIGPDESMEDTLDTAELLQLPVETVTGFNFRLKVLNGWLGKTNEVCYNRNMSKRGRK